MVFSILSIFPEYQEYARKTYTDYFEVYLKVSMDELVRRDSKGLYKKALAGEVKDVVGVDLEFPEPNNSDLVIANEGGRPIEEIANEIVDALDAKLSND